MKFEDEKYRLQNAMKKTGLTEAKITQLYEEVSKRKGCLVYLRSSALRELKICNDPFFNIDVLSPGKCQAAYISCPEGGFNIKHVLGVAPLGERDRELLLPYFK